MKSSALVFWLALAVVASGAYGSWVAWRNLHEEPRPVSSTSQISHHLPPVVGPPIKDFQLTNRDGKRFRFERTQGARLDRQFLFRQLPGLVLANESGDQDDSG